MGYVDTPHELHRNVNRETKNASENCDCGQVIVGVVIPSIAQKYQGETRKCSHFGCCGCKGVIV